MCWTIYKFKIFSRIKVRTYSKYYGDDYFHSSIDFFNFPPSKFWLLNG